MLNSELIRSGVRLDDSNYINIETSTHCIPERLAEIDKGYFLLLNTITGKYEVHHTMHPKATFQLDNPFDGLDERLIRHVKSTQVEYIDNIMAELKRKNAKLICDGRSKMHDTIRGMTDDIVSYLKPKGTDKIPDDAWTTKFI